MHIPTFSARFPTLDLSWMNEDLPMWIRRQLLECDMEALIFSSRGAAADLCQQRLSYISEELPGTLFPIRSAPAPL